jgi:RNA polymerase sigma factor (TIGR02999 family)
MEPEPLTSLLRRAQQGDREAPGQLYERVQRELHGQAHLLLRGDPRVTLQTTALVNEAWLRLAGGANSTWNDRAHFLRVAARAMRSVVVDHARARRAVKRGGGGERSGLDGVVAAHEERALDLVALDDALAPLARFDAQLAQLVELRFFAGLSLEETARVLEVSPSTVERGWRTARTWLRGEI